MRSKEFMKTKRNSIAWLVLCLLAVPASRAAVVPPDGIVAGRTVAEWSVECWRWIYSLSTNTNPQLDCEGRWATYRQPDPDVFLIAPLNGATPPCTRRFTVPAHKYILMPILALSLDNLFTADPLPPDDMYKVLDSVLNPPGYLRATLDGVSIPNLESHRATAPPFSFVFESPDNTLSCFYGHPVIGLVDPIIFDGYWLMLEPLGPGDHVLHTAGDLNVPIIIPHDLTCYISVVDNRPPIPDASATRLRTISADNIRASVVLDGSRSSDPDGDVIRYQWIENGAVIAQGSPATVSLAVGSHPIRLVVSDGNLSATNNVEVGVLTAAQAVAEIVAILQGAGLPAGEQRPLWATLMAAQRAFGSGRSELGVRQLQVFEAKVSRRLGAGAPDVARTLTDLSGEIIDAFQDVVRIE